ncbi:MAG: DUF559 domain-containing protein [Clostridia bacterium]|nr:DUF559 domain-containing protein [Clostridia bacterium]
MKNIKAHDLKYTARALRRNMTKEERHLWFDFLKKLSVTVNRQKQLEGYIVDFLIPEARIVIEIDGSQHYTEYGLEQDAKRDERMRRMGMTVLRYSNDEINNSFDGVCLDILKHLKDKGVDTVSVDIDCQSTENDPHRRFVSS